MPGIDPPTPYNWQVTDIGSAAILNAQVRDGLTFLLNPPIFFGYQNTAQSFPNNIFTSVLIDTELADSELGHSNTVNPSRYVVQRAGWYEVSGSVAFTSNATGFRAAKITKNGTTVLGSEQVVNAVSGFATTVACCQSVYAAVGDYVELQAYQNSGGPLAATSNGSMDYVTYLRLKWISN